MSFRLRDYQIDCHDKVFKEWDDHQSTLGVLPTGGGKTLVFAAIIKSAQPKRAMVLAHREELIFQARDKITATTGLECGIEMAENFVNNSLFGDIPVVISTVQTQSSRWGDRRRMGRFNPKHFGVLIIDEAHHATADSYRDIINYYTQNPDLKVLGVTATPDRTDEQALGQVFQTVAFDYEILDLIHDGWLVPVQQQFVSISGLDFSQMRTTCGDLNGADLASVMESESNLQGVAGSMIQIIGDRRTIVFTAGVKQAENLSEIFNRHRVGMSNWVCGKTNKDDRKTINDKFQNGDIQVICNCGIYTEGYDNPAVEVIGMARPTKSRALYAQMAGRATRPLPGCVDSLDSPEARREAIACSNKPSCLLIDFVGNSGKHKLMSSVDILGGKISDAACERALMKAKASGKAVLMSDELDDAEEELIEMQRQAKINEQLRRSKAVARVTYTTKVISPFDVYDIAPAKTRGWDEGKNLSEKQRMLLRKHMGVDPADLTYAQGRQLLSEQFRRWDQKLCTYKQAKVLSRYGYDTKNMRIEEASRILDDLSKNQWRRPLQTQHVPLFKTNPADDLLF